MLEERHSLSPVSSLDALSLEDSSLVNKGLVVLSWNVLREKRSFVYSTFTRHTYCLWVKFPFIYHHSCTIHCTHTTAPGFFPQKIKIKRRLSTSPMSSDPRCKCESWKKSNCHIHRQMHRVDTFYYSRPYRLIWTRKSPRNRSRKYICAMSPVYSQWKFGSSDRSRQWDNW